MLNANELITFVHRNPGQKEDTYTCHPVTGSWKEAMKSTVTDTGLKTARTVKIRIPGSCEDLANIQRGDKVLCGTFDSMDGKMFATLGRTHNALTIVDIHDNTKGINPHYYFEGAG